MLGSDRVKVDREGGVFVYLYESRREIFFFAVIFCNSFYRSGAIL